MANRGKKNGIWFKTAGTSSLCKCHWCPKMLTFAEATFDHEPPTCLLKGSQTGVIACEECNLRRSHQQKRYTTQDLLKPCHYCKSYSLGTDGNGYLRCKNCNKIQTTYS